MNKQTLKKITVLSILLMSMLFCNIVFAAGTFSVGKSDIELKEGKTTTFTIDGSTATGKVEISSSNTSVVTVSNASVWLEKSTSTIKVTAKKAGTATITVTGTVADIKGVEAEITRTIKITVKAEESKDDNKNQNTNTGSNNVITNNNSNGNNSITNNNTGSTTDKPATKSTNAYLSTLGVRISQADANELGVGIDKYDFKGFSKSSLSYKVTVPYEVEALKVSYKAAHSGATVKVTGDSGFDVGSSNKITIKVTAEDGKTTKTYTVKVTRLAEEEEKPGNIIEDDEGLFLTSLSIKGIEISPEFSKEVYVYTAKLSTNVTGVEVEAKANKENAIIEVSGNTNLIVGENTINIVVKEVEGSLQAVYQITLTKEVIEVTTTGEENNFMSNLIDNIKNYIIIAIIVVVLIIAIIITLIVLLRKENKRLRDEESEEEDNVYESDESEFEENKVEEIVKKQKIEERTNETETKNEGRRTRRKEKGRHSK